MIKKSFFFLLTFFFIGFANGQIAKKLYVISNKQVYLNSIKQNGNNELVELKKWIPSLVLDIKYATTDNFMRRVMYPEARAFARKPVAESLKKIQEELKSEGLGLKIFDGYRPYQITVEFYKYTSDRNFVANPNKGSKHNRGCAVDLTLIDLKTGKELEMPTPYDSFEKAAAANYVGASEAATKNRDFLINIMRKHKLIVLHNEWWHYDFQGWENYHLMDIAFRDL